MDTKISVREAIKLSGYTRVHLYNLIIHERIGAKKDNRARWWVDKISLLEYMRLQEREPAGETISI